MSDPGRKGVGEQAQEKITPDSQKSTFDKASESVTGTADNIAGALQPGDSKSTAQKLSDTARSYGDSAQDCVSSAAESVQNTLSGNKR